MADSDEEYADEPLDPRVQTELERLNSSSDELNQVEMSLMETRRKLKTLSASASQKLQTEADSLGPALKKSRPYFDYLRLAGELRPRVEAAAAAAAEDALQLAAAKETIKLAEMRLEEDKTVTLDDAWQDMLNYNTIRLMEVERKKRLDERNYNQLNAKYLEVERKIAKHQRKNWAHIEKSLPYMELKESLSNEVSLLRIKMEELQELTKDKKEEYKSALANLERISEEVHERRKLDLIDCSASIASVSDLSSIADLNIHESLDFWTTSSEFSSSEFEDNNDDFSNDDGDDDLCNVAFNVAKNLDDDYDDDDDDGVNKERKGTLIPSTTPTDGVAFRFPVCVKERVDDDENDDENDDWKEERGETVIDSRSEPRGPNGDGNVGDVGAGVGVEKDENNNGDENEMNDDKSKEKKREAGDEDETTTTMTTTASAATTTMKTTPAFVDERKMSTPTTSPPLVSMETTKAPTPPPRHKRRKSKAVDILSS